MTLQKLSELYAAAADQLYKAAQYEEAVHSAELYFFDSLRDFEAHLDFNASMCRQSKEAADKLIEQANAASLPLTLKSLAA